MRMLLYYRFMHSSLLYCSIHLYQVQIDGVIPVGGFPELFFVTVKHILVLLYFI